MIGSPREARTHAEFNADFFGIHVDDPEQLMRLLGRREEVTEAAEVILNPLYKTAPSAVIEYKGRYSPPSNHGVTPYAHSATPFSE